MSEYPLTPKLAANVGCEKKVLVVDDHDDTRALLRYVFESHGYQVIEATDGDDAVNLALHRHPDVIVMDTTLKRVNGLEATRRIRGTPSISHLPIVFLSGHAQYQARIDAMASGANDYLIKPVSLDQLERSIARQLDGPNPASSGVG